MKTELWAKITEMMYMILTPLSFVGTITCEVRYKQKDNRVTFSST
jgi:hypothetical protein